MRTGMDAPLPPALSTLDSVIHSNPKSKRIRTDADRTVSLRPCDVRWKG